MSTSAITISDSFIWLISPADRKTIDRFSEDEGTFLQGVEEEIVESATNNCSLECFNRLTRASAVLKVLSKHKIDTQRIDEKVRDLVKSKMTIASFSDRERKEIETIASLTLHAVRESGLLAPAIEMKEMNRPIEMKEMSEQ